MLINKNKQRKQRFYQRKVKQLKGRHHRHHAYVFASNNKLTTKVSYIIAFENLNPRAPLPHMSLRKRIVSDDRLVI